MSDELRRHRQKILANIPASAGVPEFVFPAPAERLALPRVWNSPRVCVYSITIDSVYIEFARMYSGRGVYELDMPLWRKQPRQAFVVPILRWQPLSRARA